MRPAGTIPADLAQRAVSRPAFAGLTTGFTSIFKTGLALFFALPAVTAVIVPAAAETGNVTIIAGFGPGGSDEPVRSVASGAVRLRARPGLDQLVRLYARFLGTHLPGQPAIEVRYMPGAGGVRAARFLATRAARDGSVVGAIPLAAIRLGLLVPANAQFEAARLSPVGALRTDVNLCAIRTMNTAAGQAAEVMDLKDGAIIGSALPGSQSHAHARALQAISGKRLRIIPGYPGTAGTAIAMLRGEVDGMCGLTFAAWQSLFAKLLAEGKLRPLLRFAPAGERHMSHIAGARVLAERSPRSAHLSQAAAFLEQESLLRWALYAPPETSQPALVRFAQALSALYRDRQFRRAAATRGLIPQPVPPARLSQALRDMPGISDKARALLMDWYGLQRR